MAIARPQRPSNRFQPPASSRAARVRWPAALVLLSLFMPACAVQPEQDRERSICGLKEPFVFWLWSSVAGRPNAARVADRADVEDISLTTTDRRILRGYRLRAASSVDSAGYLVIGQGNAMLADQIITDFQPFADAGYDVYVFDYRGYGRSEGKRRLRAMLSDYREILSYLDSLPYSGRSFYGMSFGGILLLDALRDDAGPKTVVIDSSPSRLSDYGCPPEHDPVANLPAANAELMVLTGEADRVVTPAMSRELVERARELGAEVVQDERLGHPFMDGRNHRRFERVLKFLRQHRGNGQR